MSPLPLAPWGQFTFVIQDRSFSQFHAVFWKIWQNSTSVSLEGRRPLLLGILAQVFWPKRPCHCFGSKISPWRERSGAQPNKYRGGFKLLKVTSPETKQVPALIIVRGNSLADRRGRQGHPPTPPNVQILSFSCSFQQTICKIID